MNRSISRWLIYLTGFLLILYLVAIPTTLLPDSTLKFTKTNNTEIRGVWLTNVASGVLYMPWGINRAVSQLAALDFNTIYPVVWNRGHTFYRSAIANQYVGTDSEPLVKWMHGGGDVFHNLTKLSHAKGLRVIPWFEYGFMTPPKSALAKGHPEWLTSGKSGKKSVEATSLDQNNGVARNQAWLNPLHPEVQRFIKNLVLEVVKNYDVDGIQFDDHFGMPTVFGYDPFTVKMYQKEHQGQKPPNDPTQSEWMRWRANKITAFMQDIYQAVKATKPQVKISLSPNSQAYSYKHYLQDWETWVKKGLVDELILQVYRDDTKAFVSELTQPSVEFARTKIPVGVGVLTGTLKNPVDIKQITQQVQTIRDRNFRGVSFFYWESLWGYIAPESPKVRRKAFLEMFNITG